MIKFELFLIFMNQSMEKFDQIEFPIKNFERKCTFVIKCKIFLQKILTRIYKCKFKVFSKL